jgi:hypothetical protein
MENKDSENGKDRTGEKARPGGSDVWDIFSRPIPMKWVAAFVILFLGAYTYVRLKHL